MKHTVLGLKAIVFFLLLSPGTIHGQDATFEETETWLNGKLDNSFVSYEIRGSKFTNEYKISIRDCFCTSISSRTFNNKKTYDYTQSKFNFKDITNAIIDLSDSANYVTIVLVGNGKIIDEVIFLTENGKQIERNLTSGFAVRLATNELANRVQKAVLHYIKLCKAKKEKF